MSRYQIETTAPDGRPIGVPIPDGFIDQILDGHAHELAEKIRKFVGPRDLLPTGEPERVVRYVAGWHDAANLIDPEVN